MCNYTIFTLHETINCYIQSIAVFVDANMNLSHHSCSKLMGILSTIGTTYGPSWWRYTKLTEYPVKFQFAWVSPGSGEADWSLTNQGAWGGGCSGILVVAKQNGGGPATPLGWSLLLHRGMGKQIEEQVTVWPMFPGLCLLDDSRLRQINHTRFYTHQTGRF